MTGQPVHYSPKGSTAVHEAGHGVMAYLLGRAFTEISVVADGDTEGHVRHAPPGEWFRPDIEVNGRVRSMIEDHVMICLAGSETEAAWCARLPDAPDGWQAGVGTGAQHDLSAAVGMADYMCGGSVPELEAYLEWLRQRVLGFTGRGAAFPVSENDPPFVAEHYRLGNRRFWALVTALADAAQETGTLTWRQARKVLRQADPLLAALDARSPVFGSVNTP